MGEVTKITWTDHTFNPWLGCTNVSPGCDHCYAELWAQRYGLVEWGNHPRHRTSPSTWKAPLGWNRKAPDFEREHGHRPRVFCASLADVFDNQVPPEWRGDLFALIRNTPNLDWLLLTKRPHNVRKMLPADWGEGWGHVWLGTTAEDAERYRQRWPILATVPAAVRFVSYEPAIEALGPLDIATGTLPDWLIAGGESGPQRRPLQIEWVRGARDQCAALGVSFFFKQIGGLRPNSAGCRLDGREWKEWPVRDAA